MLRKAISAFPLVLLPLWIWLYWPVCQYLAVLFTREEFRTNQIVLAAVALLLAYKAWQVRLPLKLLLAPPRLFIPGLAMALGGSLAYLLVEHYLDINTLSALLSGLASYGLLGLWLPADRWKKGLPAALLVIGVLPFGEHLETFVGYPLRHLTASLVQAGLSSMGFHSVGVDTILVFESGISQVDIPCSGVKSLWTGGLFLLAATWIENRPLSFRWVRVAAITGVLLCLANWMRVLLLTLAGPVLGWTFLARMLHVPLGVLGFAGACWAALSLLKHLPTWPDISLAAGENHIPAASQRPAWLAPTIVLSILLMALAYSPRITGQGVAAAGLPAWQFPDGFSTQLSPLSAQELEWIRQGGADTADRYTFRWRPEGETAGNSSLSGTLMLLSSQTWRGQHRPERCFEVYGLTVEQSAAALVQLDFPLRYLSLSAPGVQGQVSAVYWLQSPTQTTEDFGQRIWADLGTQREHWVLVTMLFDQEVSPQQPELVRLVVLLRDTVRRSLAEGEIP